LFVIDPTRGEVHRASESAALSTDSSGVFEECRPAWSNDSRLLAYEVGCYPNSTPQSIYLFDVNTKKAGQIASGEHANPQLITLIGWLGERNLVYSLPPSTGVPTRNQLMLLSVEDQTVGDLVDLEGDMSKLDLTDVSWTRNDNLVTAVVYINGRAKTLILNREQSPTLVSQLDGWSPRWSPSGNFLAYIGLGSDSKPNGLWIVDSSGNNTKLISPLLPQVLRWAPPQ
jgi:Tol biopolymer transport system component